MVIAKQLLRSSPRQPATSSSVGPLSQAIQWSLQVIHPFTVHPALPPKILENIKLIVSSPQALTARRQELLHFWHSRALALLPDTDRQLRSVPDPALRRLLRGVPDYVDLQLGLCTHVALYDEFFAAIDCSDNELLSSLRSGFPIVGEIRRSLWESTLEDVKEASTVGPFGSEEEDPSDGVPKFFVMIGHSFGLVAAVYNYNRRSAMIDDIFVKLFNMVAFNFYDDKCGFETDLTARSARTVAECVHFWLGALFDDKKLQLSVSPVILGVTFNLELLVLEIKDQRRKELTEMIDGILETGSLDPGTAGKLKGKLMYGASQLWGKVGRAFFR
ncbi:unnamed protein product, partial [Symbiodinium sp. CCMP2456]